MHTHQQNHSTCLHTEVAATASNARCGNSGWLFRSSVPISVIHSSLPGTTSAYLFIINIAYRGRCRSQDEAQRASRACALRVEKRIGLVRVDAARTANGTGLVRRIASSPHDSVLSSKTKNAPSKQCARTQWPIHPCSHRAHSPTRSSTHRASRSVSTPKPQVGLGQSGVGRCPYGWIPTASAGSVPPAAACTADT